jgi:hypothetical protein
MLVETLNDYFIIQNDTTILKRFAQLKKIVFL